MPYSRLRYMFFFYEINSASKKILKYLNTYYAFYQHKVCGIKLKLPYICLSSVRVCDVSGSVSKCQ